MRVARATLPRDLKVLKAMNTLTFPADSEPNWKGINPLAWIVYDGEDPVAFLYAHAFANEPHVMYFSRVGVMPAARGKGLQRHLMKLLVTGAKRAGIKTLISTTYVNPPSANNFVREQWMTYNPESPWGCSDTIYWRKELCPRSDSPAT